ncbi:MAG: hypothetical protein ACJAUH_000109 [Saprospiraceae bacterium]|jgi:hypothetical protein
MRILKYLGLFLFLSLLVTGCKESVDSEADAKLQEAGELHDASLVSGNEVSEMLLMTGDLIKQVEMIVPSIEDPIMQGDADAYITGITVAQADFSLWKESLVEVPGHAHDNSNLGEPHNHDHSMDKAEPADILAKQMELKEYIDDIKNRLAKAIEMSQGVVDEYGN